MYCPKLILYWNWVIKGNYANFTCFPHKSPNVHVMPFLGDKSWNFADVLCKFMSPRKRTVCFLFCSSFSTIILGSLKAQISKTKQTTKYLAKTNADAPSTSLQGLIEYARAKIQKIWIAQNKQRGLPTLFTFLWDSAWTSLHNILYLPTWVGNTW